MPSKKKVNKRDVDLNEPKMDFRQIKKEIAFLASSNMTWRERKDIENRKVVSLGGKPQKQQRRPLSVARPIIKKQKEREQKMREETKSWEKGSEYVSMMAQEHAYSSAMERLLNCEQLHLGELGSTLGNSSRRPTTKYKPEEMVLKSTAGRFRGGVLDVKHLLQPASAKDSPLHPVSGKMKGGKRKNEGKNKAGNKNRQ